MSSQIAFLVNDRRETLVIDWQANTIRLVAFTTYMAETPDIMLHPIRGLLHVAHRCRYVRDAEFGIIGKGTQAVLTINATTVLLMAQGGLSEDDLRRFLPEHDAAQSWADLTAGAMRWAAA
ncbi:hypothetical protein [Novosphingobium sp. HII-3]|uniref:hypothetical protein n=1 Tax=Novosphingobium sp. HII-3 TaxID=2075565 RepID=UPI000CDAD67A|nr:hypothetical protein [Novosphingobium sp. HII-3]